MPLKAFANSDRSSLTLFSFQIASSGPAKPFSQTQMSGLGVIDFQQLQHCHPAWQVHADYRRRRPLDLDLDLDRERDFDRLLRLREDVEEDEEEDEERRRDFAFLPLPSFSAFSCDGSARCASVRWNKFSHSG